MILNLGCSGCLLIFNVLLIVFVLLEIFLMLILVMFLNSVGVSG